MQSARIFNNNFKNCLPKLQELGAISKNCDAKEFASFLFNNPGIDKEVLGEFLGKNSEFNIEVLN